MEVEYISLRFGEWAGIRPSGVAIHAATMSETVFSARAGQKPRDHLRVDGASSHRLARVILRAEDVI
jgi:hypothetical protein